MALSTDDLERVKHYLGYHGVTIAALGYIDFPAFFTTVIQPNLSSWAETQIETVILVNLLQSDVDIQAARKRYKANKVGSIELNRQEHLQLLALRDFWITELETTTGIQRYRISGGSGIEQH